MNTNSYVYIVNIYTQIYALQYVYLSVGWLLGIEGVSRTYISFKEIFRTYISIRKTCG